MLEDDFTYVLRKALTGHGLSPADAAAQAGIAEHAVLSLLRGNSDPQTARRLAPVLGLREDAFANHSSYQPHAPDLTEITRLELPFNGDHVNAWLIEAGNEILLIDAGYDGRDLLERIQNLHGRLPDRVFITHGHRDHIGGLAALLQSDIPVHASGIAGTIAMHPGDRICCGPLVVTANDLAGHANPALGFRIDGLATPVLATGDALFAGSIGGCATPALYQLALRNLRRTLAGLPGQTALLPGHGPATSLVQELHSNPFL